MQRSINDAPNLPSPISPQNAVSLGRVGQDETDPSRAFCYVDDSGQVLVEVTLDPDGDKIQAYLCLAQTGPNAGDFVPVRPGEAVLVVFPSGDPDQAYIVGRLDDETTNLAGDGLPRVDEEVARGAVEAMIRVGQYHRQAL